MDNLQIGTFGWLHEDWQGSFYPDDMPEEWQLDYYSNAFRVVLVPQEQWLNLTEEELEEYADCVEGEFAFYLELRESMSPQKQQQLGLMKHVLGSLLSGVVVFSESWLPDAYLEDVPVTLVSESLVLPGWQWQAEGKMISGEPLGFVGDLQESGKWQTELLKSFVGTLPEQLLGAPFFVGGDVINMSRVANLKVVGEVLGY
ncbi:hypothetical protein QCB45_04470 [Thiomicrorhabdus sp. ZW0627]|uniref:hypothetical protein n=1 Tax=Thiomicrorhabdus sp. ZW0627 TaxID=3039774 RepID=UPI0024372FA6|nr:hypothetical protein [Thiomicrorhabdus sp. ZW0627]MDG6773578.1 hypothetical protein [Thiomicrorhabdus sp. ZW0627]